MTKSASARVEPTVVVRGFDEAYERLRAVLDNVDTSTPEDAFLPLFEALNWSDALCILEKAGRIELDVLPDDLRALRFARGRAHHHWGNALEIGDVPAPIVTTNRPGPKVIGPFSVRGWKWVAASRLHGRTDKLEPAYVARLEGEPAHSVLKRLFEGLSTLR